MDGMFEFNMDGSGSPFGLDFLSEYVKNSEEDITRRKERIQGNVHFRHIFEGNREENESPTTALRVEWIDAVGKVLEKK